MTGPWIRYTTQSIPNHASVDALFTMNQIVAPIPCVSLFQKTVGRRGHQNGRSLVRYVRIVPTGTPFYGFTKVSTPWE